MLPPTAGDTRLLMPFSTSIACRGTRLSSASNTPRTVARTSSQPPTPRSCWWTGNPSSSPHPARWLRCFPRLRLDEVRPGSGSIGSGRKRATFCTHGLVIVATTGCRPSTTKYYTTTSKMYHAFSGPPNWRRWFRAQHGRRPCRSERRSLYRARSRSRVHHHARACATAPRSRGTSRRRLEMKVWRAGAGSDADGVTGPSRGFSVAQGCARSW